MYNMLVFYLLCLCNLNDKTVIWGEKRVDMSPCLLTSFEIFSSKKQK
jgi:hypothetical protein